MIEVCVRSVAAGPRSMDRAIAIPADGSRLLVVADGAGGFTGSIEAADMAIAFFSERAACLVRRPEPSTWAAALAELDGRILSEPAAGETTGVVAFVSEGNVVGASVGDSGAWLVADAGIDNLTQGRWRKPLLGSGSARPIPFGPTPFRGRLIVASDGLFKYVKRERIRELALSGHVDEAVSALVQDARLPSGGLHDDLAVILCEQAGDAV